MQLLPLSSAPNQTLAATLTIDGKRQDLILKLRHNETAGYWVLDVYDRNGVALVSSLPLVTAQNLLEPHAYLGIGSIFIINASNVSKPNYPNARNLGSDFVLVWGDTP